VIVGASFFSGSGLPEARAVRWQGTTIQQLGELAGYRRSWAFAASHDGSVIVGFAYADNESAPSTSIRWVNGQPQNLGWLPLNGADGSIAYGVSGDGAIVVGNSDGRAYRWTETRGMENLNTVYASLLADGSQLYSAQAISADGRFIVGRGLQRRDQPPGGVPARHGDLHRRTTAMSTATAASMTLTCWRCCSPSGRRAAGLRAAWMSTATGASTTPICLSCCSRLAVGVEGSESRTKRQFDVQFGSTCAFTP
jgi:hypothetical protein